MKNYIKANKAKILRWIREPHTLRVESVIRAFQVQRKLLESAWNPLAGSDLSTRQIRSHLIDLNQPVALKSGA